MRVHRSLWSTAQEANLAELYVVPGHRGRGYSRELITETMGSGAGETSPTPYSSRPRTTEAPNASTKLPGSAVPRARTVLSCWPTSGRCDPQRGVSPRRLWTGCEPSGGRAIASDLPVRLALGRWLSVAPGFAAHHPVAWPPGRPVEVSDGAKAEALVASLRRLRTQFTGCGSGLASAGPGAWPCRRRARSGPLSGRRGGDAMSGATTLLPFQPSRMSTAQLAAVSFLARYSGRTHALYAFQLSGSPGARAMGWTRWSGSNGPTSSSTSAVSGSGG
jgi:hypothetical protein